MAEIGAPLKVKQFFFSKIARDTHKTGKLLFPSWEHQFVSSESLLPKKELWARQTLLPGRKRSMKWRATLWPIDKIIEKVAQSRKIRRSFPQSLRQFIKTTASKNNERGHPQDSKNHFISQKTSKIKSCGRLFEKKFSIYLKFVGNSHSTQKTKNEPSCSQNGLYRLKIEVRGFGLRISEKSRSVQRKTKGGLLISPLLLQA